MTYTTHAKLRSLTIVFVVSLAVGTIGTAAAQDELPEALATSPITLATVDVGQGDSVGLGELSFWLVEDDDEAAMAWYLYSMIDGPERSVSRARLRGEFGAQRRIGDYRWRVVSSSLEPASARVLVQQLSDVLPEREVRPPLEQGAEHTLWLSSQGTSEIRFLREDGDTVEHLMVFALELQPSTEHPGNWLANFKMARFTERHGWLTQRRAIFHSSSPEFQNQYVFDEYLVDILDIQLSDGAALHEGGRLIEAESDYPSIHARVRFSLPAYGE